MDKFITINEVKVPTFVYGTAWKEDRTEDLVGKAIAARALAARESPQGRRRSPRAL